jgi:hypothetical protein
MMIGEMDYGSIFEDRAEDSKDPGIQVWYVAVTYIQFALFLIVMAILIMNLLVSLFHSIISLLHNGGTVETHPPCLWAPIISLPNFAFIY